MNKVIFASMRAQLCPSEVAQTALWERLEVESAQERKAARGRRPLALAACAALVLCAGLAGLNHNSIEAPAAIPVHSYIVVEGSGPEAMKALREESALAGDRGTGEQEGPNTGDLPGGAYIGDIPTQPGVDVYQVLMDALGDSRPDWYGGAYVDKTGALMVLLVEELDPGDKSLELKVLDMVGGTAPVGFSSVKYSRNDLERMNREIGGVLDGRGIFATWGIYDDQNRIVLDVSEPLPEDILAAIAEIDPDDDAILIRVVEAGTAVPEELVKGPEPIGEPAQPGGVAPPYSGTVDRKEGEEPGVHFADPNAPADPEDEDLIAVEPQIEDLPGELPQSRGPELAVKELPEVREESGAVRYDLLPLE